ncbi:2TM domain-containing protein [Roseateles violae]|uniref:2TM domain-containing protein n=1 Tax=Roseateles violae TaxID=3058042 RepID=A0ABT8DP02_9BURK|nr:2TM domain-containing protein [Pelomonas sp. PFR6]MDN3919867.1 2TM domain-containing protein [Pelomonas sp. PFR6]
MNTTAPLDLEERQLRRTAARRVGIKTGFAIHALVFLLVNTGLYLLNSRYGGGLRWHQFPLMGWGLGLAIHGIVTFVSLQGMGLREQMLEREIEALRRRRQQVGR